MASDVDFPELNTDESLHGTWLEAKSPQSVATRRYLLEILRLYRRSIFTDTPKTERRKELAHLRKIHRRDRAEFIALENRYREPRKRFLAAYAEWLALRGNMGEIQ